MGRREYIGGYSSSDLKIYGRNNYKDYEISWLSLEVINCFGLRNRHIAGPMRVSMRVKTFFFF